MCIVTAILDLKNKKPAVLKELCHMYGIEDDASQASRSSRLIKGVQKDISAVKNFSSSIFR